MSKLEISKQCPDDFGSTKGPIESSESRKIVGRDLGGAHSICPEAWNKYEDTDSSRRGTSSDESGGNGGQKDELSDEKSEMNAGSNAASSISQQVSSEVSYLPMVKTHVPEPSIPESMKRGVFHIRSNCIKLDTITGSLYVYSLRYSRSKVDGDGREYFDKHSGIEEAYRSARHDPKDPLRLKENGTVYATDFKTLWLDTSIGTEPSKPWESKNFEYEQMNGRIARNVRIEFVFSKELTNIREQFQSGRLGQIQEYIRALNARISETIHERYQGQDKIIQPSANKLFLKYGYHPLNPRGTIHRIRAMRGYFVSVRPGSDSILLNINNTTSAFLPPSPLPLFIQDSTKATEPFKARKAVGSYAERLLSGSLLRICYERGPYDNGIDYNTEQKRTVRFAQFGGLAKDQKFWHLLPQRCTGEARKIDYDRPAQTVQEYFSTKNIDLPGREDHDLVCVNVGRRVRTSQRTYETMEEMMKEQCVNGARWIPACLLQIKDNQIVKSTLSPNHVSNIISRASRQPNQNSHLIGKEGFKIVVSDDRPFKTIGHEIGDSRVEVPARTLQQPVIEYLCARPKSILARWGMIHSGLRSTEIKYRVHVVYLNTSPSNCNVARKTSDAIDLALQRHKLAGYISSTCLLDNYDSALRHFLEVSACMPTDCTVALLPDDESQYSYSTIKRIADFVGKHVVCVKANKIVRTVKTANKEEFFQSYEVASYLALKINIKLGGENHRITLRSLRSTFGVGVLPIIVMGADVAHPSPTARDGCPSVASVVASEDYFFMRYKGSMRLQAGRQEKIENMYSMVKERLSAWRKSFKFLPKNILFYRDGVSESQFELCKTHEIAAISQAYKDLAPANDDSHLHLTFIVVVKRHHTRFYSTADPCVDVEGIRQRIEPYNSNFKPGLLVTDVVTNPNPPNFFLQSHSSPQGSARPTHYHILHDGMNLGMERLPDITNLLCYAFARATSAVSYVAPTYIADRLCARGMHYLGPWKDVTSDLGPYFKLSREARNMTKEEIVAEKQAFAVKLNERLVRDSKGEWDVWETDEEEGDRGPESQRLNPWHPRLDEEMFWL